MTWVHITFVVNSTATLYPYPSTLHHEGQPQANHIYFPIYIDVLYECRVVLHADQVPLFHF
jgi:hypothetical protein